MSINKNLYKVVFTKDAKQELNNIFYYISNNLYQKETSKKLMLRIEDVVQNLKFNPKIYPIIRNYSNLTYRKIAVENYIILYSIYEERNMIYIVHIYNSKMNYIDRI